MFPEGLRNGTSSPTEGLKANPDAESKHDDNKGDNDWQCVTVASVHRAPHVPG